MVPGESPGQPVRCLGHETPPTSASSRPNDYPYETCRDCAEPVSLVVRDNKPTMYWRAPDDLWLSVVGTDERVLCPGCFTARAVDKGIYLAWTAEAIS